MQNTPARGDQQLPASKKSRDRSPGCPSGCARILIAALAFFWLCGSLLVVTDAQAGGGGLGSSSQTTYVYDELGRLVQVIGPLGVSATYHYDAVGNLLAITIESTSGSGSVSVSDISPEQGPVGTAVTISGSGFSTTASSDSVSFNGAGAAVSSATANSIVATVPSGATTGPVTVTSPNGSAASGEPFTVTSSAPGPTITGFSPSIGAPGTPVTITGTNFSTSQADDDITFAFLEAPTTSASTTTLGTMVPPEAGPGPITVSTPLGDATSSTDFLVPPPGVSVANEAYAAQIALGATVPISINTSGQQAMLVFNGTAGQSVSVYLSNSTFSGCNNLTVNLLAAGWSVVGSTTLCDTSGQLAAILPETGAYTVQIFDTNGTNSTGSASVSVLAAAAGTTSIGGSAVPLSISTAGQIGAVTFTSNNANQQISALISNSTFSGCSSVYFNLYAPDYSELTSGNMCSGSTGLLLATLPQPGTYTLQLVPSGYQTGSLTVQIYNATPQSGSITVGGPSVPVTTNAPGVQTNLTFNATFGQVTTLSVTGSTYTGCAAVSFNIIDPNGHNVGNSYACGSSGTPFTNFMLLSSGTYTLNIVPSGSDTGTMNVQLLNLGSANGMSNSVTTSDSYAQTILADHPYAYWRVDEASGPTAVSAAPGVFLGQPSATGITYGTAGALVGDPDTAITLDGSSGSITLPLVDAATWNMTLECWVNINSSTAGPLIKMGDVWAGYGIGIGNTNTWGTAGTNLIPLYSFGNFLTANGGNPSLSQNTWHHVALVLDGSANPTMYLDGVAYSFTSAGTPTTPTTNSYIGGGGGEPNFGGSIDEVAIYKAALSATQIQNHYLAGTTNPTNYGSAGVTGGTNYKAVILNDSPLQYYRLDDSSGAASILESAALIGDNGLYQGNVTFGSSGVISTDNAIQLDGSTSYFSSVLIQTEQQNPFSMETWFKTTTTSGGKLIGFGNQQTGPSSYSDIQIYMSNSGTLLFTTFDDAQHIIQTTAAYNDGNWHHVVGTWASNTLNLYVDGSLVGSTTGGVRDVYSGYWRIGYDYLYNFWPTQPSSLYFAGTIDEVAVYPYALSAAQVANHYSAAGR